MAAHSFIQKILQVKKSLKNSTQRKVFQNISLSFLLLTFFLLSPIHSQDTILFPGAIGQELLDSLVLHYRTTRVLSYANARDTLFSKIDSQYDSLRCVYTGYTIYLDPNQDPTVAAYALGINTEHTWPRSKGATGQAESDMHHLYATREVVNSARANNPFAEIPDDDTDLWFRLNTVLNNTPAFHIEEYSEVDVEDSLFEPREDHKGNVARSMFYFYTMYESEANARDPDFFDIQKEGLFQWHQYDPVDFPEKNRTMLIAGYQGDCPNPFVLDSTLVRRTYFPGTVDIGRSDVQPISTFTLSPNFPNPFNPVTTISVTTGEQDVVTFSVYDLRGSCLASDTRSLLPGTHDFRFDGTGLASGIYFLRVSGQSGEQITRKIVLQK
ncbi:MAG: endonuclease [Calditrichaeota bacterium]|nr:endonuclease [Calditrichota bacterium]